MSAPLTTTPEVRGFLKDVLNGEVRSHVERCRIHGDYQATLMPNGKYSGCPGCIDEDMRKEEERQMLEFNRLRKIRGLRNGAKVPKRFQSRTLDNFIAETDKQRHVLKVCRAYVDRFDDRLEQGGGLILLGSVGTGKSHLAYGIGNALLEQERSVMGIDVYELMDLIKEKAFSKESGSSERAAIKSFVSGLDLLILDEIGAQLGTDWESLMLFKIINERYKQMLPTILISNLDRQALGEYLGERIVDRMQEGGGATLTLDWESYRSKRSKGGSHA